MTRQMTYIIQAPPNTKRAEYIKGRFTVAVTCPHCCKIHHHPRSVLLLYFVKAQCCDGYYRLEKDVQP